ncbi:hypothetical protein PC129_g11420 [Phytophthora cactorum]|uniref:Uncharacterized protein n=1 Tax=Phytophthora cactorum TaxID=29920 RepID=A0A8T1I1I2_9STRA|nr:hypothetical protein PC129_g11420 [Phytophthora cactorum]
MQKQHLITEFAAVPGSKLLLNEHNSIEALLLLNENKAAPPTEDSKLAELGTTTSKPRQESLAFNFSSTKSSNCALVSRDLQQ